jgi:hypothetical protein
MEKKPTWKSTTFLLIVVTNAITIMGAIAQYIPPQTAAIITTVLTGIFSACNAWIKVNSQSEPILPDNTPVIPVNQSNP